VTPSFVTHLSSLFGANPLPSNHVLICSAPFFLLHSDFVFALQKKKLQNFIAAVVKGGKYLSL
jgi:hypothetical protein